MRISPKHFYSCFSKGKWGNEHWTYMYEKPSGIAHHTVIYHFACISLSTLVDPTLHAIVTFTLPATTMLIMSHLYSLSSAYTTH